MSDRIALGVMARAPSDDRGKTRLIRALDIEDGAGLRRAILLDTLESIGAVHLADRIILFTPDDAREEVAGLDSDAARLLPQRGETLSQRLISGFADLFALGYDAAAIVGSDLPTLPAAHVEEGIAALAQLPDPIVLGPSDDGGYYFIGLRRPHPELFRGVPWSTPDALASTLAIAAAENLAVTLISSWYDVDAPADLERALNDDARHLRTWSDARMRKPMGNRGV
jgi:rSAM/selenodomain-associated transferase 1